MPQIRPFRALRFDPSAVGDVADVIAPAAATSMPPSTSASCARHPANVVRVDLPEDRSGDEPDDRYRRAARALAEWRSGAILHKDPHPSDLRLRAAGPGDVDGAGASPAGLLRPAAPRSDSAPSAGIEADREGAAAASDRRSAIGSIARDRDQLAPGHRAVRRLRRARRTHASRP